MVPERYSLIVRVLPFFILFNLLISGLPVLTGCAMLRPASLSSSEFMPGESEFPGWTLLDSYSYSSATEIKKIFPRLAGYSVKSVAAAHFFNDNDNDFKLSVLIVQFKTGLESFGFYSVERGFNDENNPIENAFYNRKNAYCFHYGLFYFILHSNRDISNIPLLLKIAAHSRERVMEKIKPFPLPKSLNLFRDPGSSSRVIYYKKGVDLIPGSEEIFVIKTLPKEGGKLLFFMKKGSTHEVDDTMTEIIKSDKKHFSVLRASKLQFLIKKLNNGRYLAIANYKEWIFGVLNADNIGEGNKILLDHLIRLKKVAIKR